jgi:hypothetical protein
MWGKTLGTSYTEMFAANTAEVLLIIKDIKAFFAG